MANQDTTDKVENGENIDKGVEVANATDETEQKDNQNNQSETGEQNEVKSEDSTSEDDTQTKDETKVEFKKRFTQLKGETPEEYLKNLEDAYANSSTEGQRTAKEAKEATAKFAKVAQLVASDPDFAARLDAATDENAPKPLVDPAIAWAKQEMDKEYTRDYRAFSDLHTQMISDPEIRDNMIAELDIISAANEARGKRLSMADGLRKAWISLGYDELDKKDDVVNKIKEQASTTSTQTTKKSDSKQEFTAEQIAMAAKMGLTEKQLAQYYK